MVSSYLWICSSVIDSLLDNSPQFSHFHINSLHIKSWILQKAGQGFIWVTKCCVSDDPLFSSGKISMFSSEMLFLYSFVYGRFAISIWKKLQSRKYTNMNVLYNHIRLWHPVSSLYISWYSGFYKILYFHVSFFYSEGFTILRFFSNKFIQS